MYSPKPSPKTDQEALDNVIQHFLVENNDFSKMMPYRKGIAPNCFYRGHDDAMCGIGCQIPNEKYKSVMEGYTVANKMVLSVFSENITVELLVALQFAHDDAMDKVELYDTLKDIAETFKLKFLS